MKSEASSTHWEDVRREILYTCEERYDGSMVAYVLDLQRQLTAAQAKLDALRGKVLNARTLYSCEFCRFFPVPVDEDPCDGCSRNPAYPWDGIGAEHFEWMNPQERSDPHDAG